MTAPRIAIAAVVIAGACVAEPRMLEVAVATDLGPVSALDVSIRGGGRGDEVTRCQRFPPGAVSHRIALPDDVAAPGDQVVVTALGEDGAPVGVGEGELEGDALRLPLAAIERALPRAVSTNTSLAEGHVLAGRQLAIADGGEAALVWLDTLQEAQVQGRRIDEPSRALPDRDLTPFRDRGRSPPVVASLGDRFAVAWIYGQQSLQLNLLSTELAFLDGGGGSPVATAAGADQVDQAGLIAAGPRLLATWVSTTTKSSRVGRVGVRWLSHDGAALRDAAFLGPIGGTQTQATGAVLPSGDVILAWLDGSGATTRIHLVRIPAGGEPALDKAVILTVDGAPVTRTATLAMAPDGDGVAIAWSDEGQALDDGIDPDDGRFRVWVAHVDGALTTGAVKAIDLGNVLHAKQVALASRGADGLIAAWNERARSGVTTAYVRWLAPGGAPLGPPQRAGLLDGGDQTFLSVAGHRDGRAAIAWQQGPGPDRVAGIVGRLLGPDDVSRAPVLCNRPGAADEAAP